MLCQIFAWLSWLCVTLTWGWLRKLLDQPPPPQVRFYITPTNGLNDHKCKCFCGWWEPGIGVHYTCANTSDLTNTGSNIKIIYTRLNFTTTIRSPRTFFKKKWKVQNYIQWSHARVYGILFSCCDLFFCLWHDSCLFCTRNVKIAIYRSLFQAFSSVRKKALFYFFARCFRRCALTNWKPARD